LHGKRNAGKKEKSLRVEGGETSTLQLICAPKWHTTKRNQHQALRKVIE
jgi:hypothetical protein